jgi:phosphatidylglycerol:prolipoprotein diacylglycerol transferase
MAYLTGFAVAFWFMSWLSRRKRTPLSVDDASDFLTFLILGVLLGGRFGYIAFYSPELLTDVRSSFPFWGGLAVWEGGMASHGGFIGVILACIYFSWRKKVDALHLGDLTIFGASFGIFLGRIANFVNGELMGRVCSPELPWAVKFPQDMHRWVGYEPDKLNSLSSVVSHVGVSPEQWQNWLNGRNPNKLYDVVDQLILAIQNGNESVRQALAPFLEPRHPSQLYGAFVEGLIPLAILALVWLKPRKPGLICSAYLILYSFSRVIDEMFRLPDAHLSDLSQLPLGLSRGQFLSLFLFAFGVVLMVLTLRRQAPLYGGLLFGAEEKSSPAEKSTKTKKKKEAT